MKLLYWVVFVLIIYYNHVYHWTKNPLLVGLLIAVAHLGLIQFYKLLFGPRPFVPPARQNLSHQRSIRRVL
jgi:hypothetical protein